MQNIEWNAKDELLHLSDCQDLLVNEEVKFKEINPISTPYKNYKSIKIDGKKNMKKPPRESQFRNRSYKSNRNFKKYNTLSKRKTSFSFKNLQLSGINNEIINNEIKNNDSKEKNQSRVYKTGKCSKKSDNSLVFNFNRRKKMNFFRNEYPKIGQKLIKKEISFQPPTKSSQRTNRSKANLFNRSNSILNRYFNLKKKISKF